MEKHRRWLIFILLLPLLLPFLYFGVVILYSLVFPLDLCALKERNPRTTAFIERYREAVKKRTGKAPAFTLTFTPLSQISPFLKEAVILAEDPRFYEHPGIDLKELWEALKTNLKRKRYVRGASTIPQQLVKNLYLSPEKSLTRKGREIILALRLCHCVPRSRILELYLNVIEWGPGVYGVTRAAQHYFHKHPRDLTPEESALLVSVLPNPRRYRLTNPPPWIRKKAEQIEEKLK